MKFVDTGAWYAAYVRNDPAHATVRPLIDDTDELLVTSDFVLAEAMNLFQARGEFDRALLLGRQILEAGFVTTESVTPADQKKAFVYFSGQTTRGWSFTDCTSLVVMQRLGIRKAIALDRHFRQMPGIEVLP